MSVMLAPSGFFRDGSGMGPAHIDIFSGPSWDAAASKSPQHIPRQALPTNPNTPSSTATAS